MAAFAEEIDDRPVIATTVKMFRLFELSGFRAPQPAPEQQRKNGTIPFADQRFSIWATEYVLRLLCAEPVPEPHAQTLGAPDPANAGRQVRAEQSYIGSFVGVPPDGC